MSYAPVTRVLDIWRPVYKMAYDATTVYEKRLASNLFHHLNSAADYLLEGGVDGACYQLQAVCDKLTTINEQKENQNE